MSKILVKGKAKTNDGHKNIIVLCKKCFSLVKINEEEINYVVDTFPVGGSSLNTFFCKVCRDDEFFTRPIRDILVILAITVAVVAVVLLAYSVGGMIFK